MPYFPERGHAVWLDFDPQAGHEQAGRRPALVISPAAYNKKVGLALFCPITNQIKGYPFEVTIPKGQKVSGVILSDQVKSLDWQIRKFRYICKVDEAIVRDVIKRMAVLFKN